MNPWNNGNSYDPEPPEPFSWLSKPCIWCYAIIAFLCILFVGIGLARAEPPPGATGPVHDWFESQKNLAGQACCSISDGHVLKDEEVRIVGSFYQVWVVDTWWTIPPRAIIRAPDNPMKAPIAWYVYYPGQDGREGRIHFYCFLPWQTGD